MPISIWTGRLTTIGASKDEVLGITAAYNLMPFEAQQALDLLVNGIANADLLIMLGTWRAHSGPFVDGYPGGGLPFGTGVPILTGDPADDDQTFGAGTGVLFTPSGGGGGTVVAVTAGDGTITIGGSGSHPTVKVTAGTFDAAGVAASAVATETTRAEAAEALLAPLASPGFTGTPNAPTPSLGDTSSRLATMAAVAAAIAASGGGGGGGPITPTPVADADYTALSTDVEILYTSLSTPRVVTLISGTVTGQPLAIIDGTGLADRVPIIIRGTINNGPAAILDDRFGRIDLLWNGTTWLTNGWACMCRPAIPTGTIHYVSPTGSDANNGLTTSTPWQTIAHAMNQPITAGGAIMFQGGQTFSDSYFNPGNTTAWVGTQAAPIVIGSYGGGQAILSLGSFFVGSQATWITFDNVELHSATNAQCFQAGTTGNAASHVRLQRCVLTQPDAATSSSPAVITLGDHIAIEGCFMFSTGAQGIQPQPGSSTHLIRRNLIYAIGLNSAFASNTHHMYLNASDVVVVDNRCVGTVAQAAFAHASSAISVRYHNSQVVNNRIAATNSGIDFSSEDGNAGVTHIRKNRMRCLGSFGIFTEPDSMPLIESFVIDENDIWLSGTGTPINLGATTGTIDQHADDFFPPENAVNPPTGGGGGGGGVQNLFIQSTAPSAPAGPAAWLQNDINGNILELLVWNPAPDSLSPPTIG